MLADTFGSGGTKTLRADFSIHAENPMDHLCVKVGSKTRDYGPPTKSRDTNTYLNKY
jgi:hypothetical protein